MTWNRNKNSLHWFDDGQASFNNEGLGIPSLSNSR